MACDPRMRNFLYPVPLLKPELHGAALQFSFYFLCFLSPSLILPLPIFILEKIIQRIPYYVHFFHPVFESIFA